MSSKKKKKSSPLEALSEEEIKELQEIYEQRKVKFASDKQEVNNTSQPIYSNITINIGGPNAIDSATDQYGKPTVPPYGGG